MNPSQNVLKMSTVSLDIRRKTATPLTDGCNNEVYGPTFSIELAVSVSVLQDFIIMSHVVG